MSSQQQRAREIFNACRRAETPRERAAIIDRECAGDGALQSAVVNMLEIYDANAGFLEEPPISLLNQAGLSLVAATLDMPPATKQTGSNIGPYKLLQQIGEGGFGVVYMAQQTEPVRRKVALKIIKPGMDTKEVIARFEAERQALALMDHPNIAKVLDAGTTRELRNADCGLRNTQAIATADSDVVNPQSAIPNPQSPGRPYFVMELVHGVPITEFCDDNKLTTRERLQLFVDVCRAVQHAHQKGIIHRDLKPANVLISMNDDRPMPKVIDFGISKALSQQLTEKTLFTAYGQMVGTPLYMSPEQAQFTVNDVDTRSDVYSLGVLLYELLTGHTPFDKEALQRSGFDEMRRMIREVDPPRPSARVSTLHAEALSTVSDKRKVDPRKLGQSLRGELDWIVMKALEKDRNRRYESASAFAADVERFLSDEPVQACPPSLGYRLRKTVLKHRVALAMAAVVVFSLLGGSAIAINYAVQAEASREQEAVERQKAEDAAERESAQLARAERNLHLAIQALKNVYIRTATGPLAKNAELVKVRKQMLAESLRLFKLIGTANATNAELQLEVAKAHHNVGTVLMQTNQIKEAKKVLEDAVAAHRRALAIADKTGTYKMRYPGVDDYLGTSAEPSEGRDRYEVLLTAAIVDLASALDSLGRKRASIERQREVLAITRRLIRDHPGKCLYPRMHVLALGNLNSTLDHHRDAEEIERNYKEAIAVGERQVKQYPKAELDRQLLALQYMNYAIHLWSGRKKSAESEAMRTKAIAHFEQCAKVARKDDYDVPNWLAQCYETRAWMYHEMKQDDKAVSPARKALAIRKQIEADKQTYPQMQFLLAKGAFWLGVYLRKQPPEEARREAMEVFRLSANRLRRLIALEPEVVQHRDLLAAGLRHLGDLYSTTPDRDSDSETAYRESIKVLDERIKRLGDKKSSLSPSAPREILARACNGLGSCYLKRRKHKEALDYFRKAVSNDSKFAGAWNNVAMMCSITGDSPATIEALRHLLKLKPNNANALNNLAYELLTIDDPTIRNPGEALRYARQAVKVQPKNADYQNTLSEAAFRAGRWRESLAARRKTIELRSPSVEDELFLSMTHWRLGDRERARAFFNSARSRFQAKPPTTLRMRQLYVDASTMLGVSGSAVRLPVAARRPE